MNPIFSSAANIEIQASASAKALIERAAALKGMTISDFAASVLIEKSREVLQASEATPDPPQISERYSELLQTPPEPKDASESAPHFRYAAQPLDLLI